jgi:RHS repeat-associated protein
MFTAATSNYRYGFNGKEKDNEVKGEGNQYDYGFRIYDPRVVRFLSVDPLQKKYPELTPYQYASNSPVDGIDLDGLEVFAINGRTGETASGPLYLPNYPASAGWVISNGQPPPSPTAPQYSAVKPVINPSHSEAPPLAIQQQKARANNSQRPATPARVTPTIAQYTPPATQQGRDAQNARVQNLNAQNGLNADGRDAFLTRLAGNKTLGNLNDNIVTPLMVLDGAYGLGRGGASLLLKNEKIASIFSKNLYRFDTRSYSQIVESGGFNSYGIDMNLMEHANGNNIFNRTSGFIGTSKSYNATLNFANETGLEGYIYKIKPQATGRDVNKILGSASPFPYEQEVAIPLNIPASDVKPIKKVGGNQ